MASKKTREQQAHTTKGAVAISTNKSIMLTSANNEGTGENKADGSVREDKNGDDIDQDGLTKDGDNVIENTKQKDKKKRKKRKNKKAKKTVEPQEEVANKRRNNIKLAPIQKPGATEDNTAKPTPAPVHSGCLGFITSWLAKRKERRREKKRQAIRARFSHSLNTKLKEFEHKRSRGGVAFTVELDSRPLKKPLLPPIQTQSGPIKLGCEDKLQTAEKKRQEHLAKRREFVRAQEEKRNENAARKADNERGFSQKAALTIIAKQGQAKRNQSRLERDRRCASVLGRTTSAMPRAISGASDDSADSNFFD